LLRRSPARFIAVLGSFNAGKTSLLASFFLQLAQGQAKDLPYRFASSLTLKGFRDLAERANQWSGSPTEGIVPRTVTETRRFLHLGLRPSHPRDDRHLDVLISDLPGEWTRDWIRIENEAAQRRFDFLPRANGFMVVVDSHTLLKDKGNQKDAETSRVLRRITDLARSPSTNGPRRGLALVLSKLDLIIDEVEPPSPEARFERTAWGALGQRLPRTWQALEQAREAGLELGIFPVSAFPRPLSGGQPVGVVAPFAQVLSVADRRERWLRRVVPVPERASSFQALRRWEVSP
jgi:hypothetical protein